jgi:23S rRNA (pseudouridine1915-N3)-methyltransferase
VHIRLIAVGDRQPVWVDDAFAGYASRLPREWRFRIDCVAAARRAKGDRSTRARDEESDRVLARIDAREQVVLLDERGKQWTSPALAQRLSQWLGDGRDLCFVIGGADGVSPACRLRADLVLSLSKLTLPHGLARVVFAEQLYRAWTLASGHPYHRE